MSRPRPARFALVIAALGACAPTTRGGNGSLTQRVARAPAGLAAAPPDAGAPASVAVAPERPDLPREPGVACPLPFDDADVVLARVGPVVITACDVVVASRRATREGRQAVSTRALLAELVDDALLASEAQSRGLHTEPVVARRGRETLAAGVVQSEARTAVHEPVDDAAVERFYRAHLADFTTPERAHLRELVVATESEALAAIRDAARVPFDALVRERTITAEGRRDEGDLGLVTAAGNDHVPRALAEAGHALGERGAIATRPLRVETTVLVGRRHRPSTRVAWHVVQLLERLPAETVPLAEAARRIRFRLASNHYRSAHTEARARLLEALTHAQPAHVNAAALRRVRVRPGVTRRTRSASPRR